MSVWLVMVICGLLTFGLRLSFIAAEGRVTFPRWFRVLLPFVPVATLTALVIPELLLADGALWLSWRNTRLMAGIVAIIIAAATRSVLWTLVGGFATLALWSSLIG
ncbi:MAG: AzlD domain-containing protein [Candidatus Competibacter denitrificans]|jgi:branched-subunit amino acid transport protein